MKFQTFFPESEGISYFDTQISENSNSRDEVDMPYWSSVLSARRCSIASLGRKKCVPTHLESYVNILLSRTIEEDDTTHSSTHLCRFYFYCHVHAMYCCWFGSNLWAGFARLNSICFWVSLFVFMKKKNIRWCWYAVLEEEICVWVIFCYIGGLGQMG